MNIIKYLQNEKRVLLLNSSKLSSLSRLERSFFYVPGDKQKMINKFISFPPSQSPDIVVFDCEDAVSFDNKELARTNILNFFNSDFISKCLNTTLCIRTNNVASSLLVTDDIRLISESLKATNYRYPQMVNIPKVENFEDVLWFDDKLKSCIDTGKLVQPLLLSCMIESCTAVIKLQKLLKKLTTKELSCLEISNIVFGSDDYCATLGVSRSHSNDEVLYARQHVANVAAAYKVSAIDMVDIDLTDMEYYEKNCKFGASIGFVGKQVIHPKQLDIVHSAFSPSVTKIEWATELIKEYEQKKEVIPGAFVFRNRMIDMPTIIQAQRVVSLSTMIKNKCHG